MCFRPPEAYVNDSKCPSCGATIPGGTMVCPQCGLDKDRMGGLSASDIPAPVAPAQRRSFAKPPNAPGAPGVAAPPGKPAPPTPSAPSSNENPSSS